MEKRRRDGRHPRDFWEHFFGDFNDEFMIMRRQMDKFMRDSMKFFNDDTRQGKPFVYGFSVKMGPDGIPHIEQFGDTKFGGMDQTGKGHGKGREPLTDIIEAVDHIVITMELPGIEKKEINLEVTENELVVDVDTDARKYYKEQKLPEKLDTDKIEANYKNGVLDIKIMRKVKEPKKGKKIEIK